MLKLAAFDNSQHARHAQSVLETRGVPSTVINQVLDGAQQEYALLVDDKLHNDALKSLKAQKVPHLDAALLTNKGSNLSKQYVFTGFFLIFLGVLTYYVMA